MFHGNFIIFFITFVVLFATSFFPTFEVLRNFAFLLTLIEFIFIVCFNRCLPAPNICDLEGFKTDLFLATFEAKGIFDESEDWYVLTMSTMPSDINFSDLSFGSNIVELAFFTL